MTIESEDEMSVVSEGEEKFGLDNYDDGIYHTLQQQKPLSAESNVLKKCADASGVSCMSALAEAAGRSRRVDKLSVYRSAHEAADEDAIKSGMFEEVVTELGVDQNALMFDELGLCRVLLRALAVRGFSQPTAIQERVIPLVLGGWDVCASAVTGSGKTAAFALPALERIIRAKHRGKTPRTRVLILLPTRELAAQCMEMVKQLAVYADATPTLIVGGRKDVRQQETALRANPDIVIATPGRLLDLMTNAHNVHLNELEICVLDEADRLLELGFEDELKRLLDFLPGGSERAQAGLGRGQRQTLLFSATFGAKVESLVTLSLQRPLRVRVASGHGAGGVAARLTQDFVRLRCSDAESLSERRERESALVALLTKTLDPNFQSIVFFDTKSATKRVAAVLQALAETGKIKNVPSVTQLHGGLKQQMRNHNLAKFERGDVTTLLCTDVAARGLDINNVAAVINFEMPRTVATYVHRVGRTARAGRVGCAVTLVGAARRNTLKEFLRARQAQLDAAEADGNAAQLKELLSAQLYARTIAPTVLSEFKEAISVLEPAIESLLQMDVTEAEMAKADMDAIRARNILLHSSEIAGRPKREWFQSTKGKLEAKARAKAEIDKQDPHGVLTFVSKDADKQKCKPQERQNDKPHRLSRLKRRRLEAKAALDNMQKKKKKKPYCDVPEFQSQINDDQDDAAHFMQYPNKTKREDIQSFDCKEMGPKIDTVTGWIEFDPNKVSLHRKKATKGHFKSSKRYKRR